MKKTTFAAVLLLAGFLPGLAIADTVTLKNGREIHGRLLRETKEFLFLRVSQGGVLRIEKGKVRTFTENNNYGLDYGKGGIEKPKTPEKKPDGEAAKPAKDGKPAEGTAKDGAPKGSSDRKNDWKDKLPAAHESLSDEQKEDLLAKLEANRPYDELFLPDLELGPGDGERIKELFDMLGYVRKAGNRGRREVALGELTDLGLKTLEPLVKSIGHSNYYRCLNTLRLLAAIAEVTEGWRFYAFHFKVPSKIVPLLGDQSEPNSFAIRTAANACLEKLSGKSFKFAPNNDQFRTRAQVNAQTAWKGYWDVARKRYEKVVQRRADNFKRHLDEWENGITESPATPGDSEES